MEHCRCLQARWENSVVGEHIGGNQASWVSWVVDLEISRFGSVSVTELLGRGNLLIGSISPIGELVQYHHPRASTHCFPCCFGMTPQLTTEHTPKPALLNSREGKLLGFYQVTENRSICQGEIHGLDHHIGRCNHLLNFYNSSLNRLSSPPTLNVMLSYVP